MRYPTLYVVAPATELHDRVRMDPFWEIERLQGEPKFSISPGVIAIACAMDVFRTKSPTNRENRARYMRTSHQQFAGNRPRPL
jgi:hypothetical protein